VKLVDSLRPLSMVGTNTLTGLPIERLCGAPAPWYFPVTVAEFKDEEATKVAAAAKGKKEPAKTDKLGLAVKEVPADQKKALKVQAGVTVEAADGAALAAGISPGDVILRVNNVDITGVKSFNDTVAKLDAKKPVALLVRDENGTRFITFRPDVG